MNMIESFSIKQTNPFTKKAFRKYVFKFSTGNSCAFSEMNGWSFYNKVGSLLNPKKEAGMKAIAAMKQAMEAGI